MTTQTTAQLTSLNIAILTVSDTRDESTDRSGNFLKEQVIEEGHNVVEKVILPDDKYAIRAQVAHWIAQDKVESVLITGGTGFASRDVTPEAVTPLFDKEIVGFGEVFRHISYLEIGNSTIQSRALAGVSNNTVIFCMPGSTGACKTAWSKIIKDQLDSRHKPCNYASLIKRPQSN
ncbi:molybdenum cofactor biosynthesis protein B [Pseudoalteromonas rubra]|uniref:Molybdenum cofactor biosynthesis protein B n=1 Tax=Pseudoalteromonas rubra TaxID=43658 RepID=A0A0U3I4M1_9GAMM|nr:molybdenum cofactor biosynthesis protein B [Pseudoalteromonas rubra]ALU44918.1 molybdenum cofactor biosynthesis protein [Pseudoalteromonas rubra]